VEAGSGVIDGRTWTPSAHRDEPPPDAPGARERLETHLERGDIGVVAKDDDRHAAV
jgi:hypothetical protein